MFSKRTAWDLRANSFAEALEMARGSGRSLIDLSESNPTRCGLTWSGDELSALLSSPTIAEYEPDPRGLPEARTAVASYLAERSPSVGAEHVLLTASTSEAYALLFKLLCEPGDEVLVPAPSYPLLEQLAELESVRLRSYPLRYDGEWHIDRQALADAVTPSTRAVVVVSPSNPTGALVSEGELVFLQTLCAEKELALLGDEVFSDTALARSPSVLSASGCLAFHLGGLSKSCGLPQLKVSWLAAAGPARLVEEAMMRLELMADAYLSVSTPAQRALPLLLARRGSFIERLRGRLAANRSLLAEAEGGEAPWNLLNSGGGWTAVLQMGEAVEEESLCLSLLQDGVVVQPGFFYDFPRNGYVVVSLLPESETFQTGVARLVRRLKHPL